jgi:DNA-binding PadR family transcriptional regulator
MRSRHFAFHRFQQDPESGSPGNIPWRFGHRGFGWGGFHRAWGRVTRRGDIKYLVLESLADGPRHGYDIITNFEERYGSRPSPGSIYPTLQMLEDAGHVTSAEQDGKRVYTITDSGRHLLEKRPVPDDEDELDEGARHRVRAAAKRLMMALMGARGSSDAALDKVAQTLEKARKDIYSILSGDEA